MMDSGIELDIEGIIQNIEEADVVTFYFPLLGKTLLVDTRCNQYVGPMVRVVPIARDSNDRLHSVRRLRPQLPRPDSITMIPWTGRVESIVTLGIWDHLLARFEDKRDAGHCRDAAVRSLEKLRRLERLEMASAILGTRYETLWPAPIEAD